MAVPNPDSLYFQYIAAGGAADIALGLEVDEFAWRIIAENDIYQWSYGNRRTFWSFGDFSKPLKQYHAVPAVETVAEGFWSLSEGRLDIIVDYDIEQVTLTIRLYDNAGVNFVTASPAAGARAQGSTTFAAVASTATEGYFTLEMTPALAATDAIIYGVKLIEQRIAQADL